MNVDLLSRALRVYTLTHPGETDTTVKQFAEWFLHHPYYSHGGAGVPCECEACGMSWGEHQTPKVRALMHGPNKEGPHVVAQRVATAAEGARYCLCLGGPRILYPSHICDVCGNVVLP